MAMGGVIMTFPYMLMYFEHILHHFSPVPLPLVPSSLVVLLSSIFW